MGHFQGREHRHIMKFGCFDPFLHYEIWVSTRNICRQDSELFTKKAQNDQNWPKLTKIDPKNDPILGPLF